MTSPFSSNTSPTPRSSERGNVLFLILIAVALFAALSYAVSRSEGGGGTNTGSEAALILTTQITQFPVTVNAGILRMIINSTDLLNLEFNSPSDFGTLSNDTLGVFHPLGGAVTYAEVNADAMLNGQKGTWHFNAEFEVEAVGTSVPGSTDGNDIIAFLAGIRPEVCARINENMSLAGPATVADNAYYTLAIADWDNAYTPPASEKVIGVTGNAALANLTGKPAGCYYVSGSNQYVFYQVVIER